MFDVEAVSELIESVAPVLGFVPERSLVVMPAVAGAGAVMRVDLDMISRAGALGEIAAVAAAGVPLVALFVSEDGANCALCEKEFAATAAALAEVLCRCAGKLVAAYVVDRLTEGGRWRCLDRGGVGGVLGDPAESKWGIAAAVSGRYIFGSRREIEELVTVDAGRVAHFEVLLGNVGPDGVGVAEAIAVARRVARGFLVAEGELAQVAAMLVDRSARDAMAALAASAASDEMEALWWALVRSLPGRWRVEALVLLAVSVYVRGDGVLARVALDAALEVDSSHTLARLLDRALTAGIEPSEIRVVATEMLSSAGLVNGEPLAKFVDAAMDGTW
ncbi:DUF4192 domain-containing protein [Mycobacterium paragordonae]|uniref:DUF4192 domain-containing protein n=1 Tax=Mycobacterium paragordonae TaxID=1389713 RepID=UPI0013C4FD8B|nr:DUF4192 domain-containing protein [Mycobacterium paragordonae]